MDIKVSSITYVRNGEKFIERCIRSIINQSLREIEIIVVDGNSTDKTYEILENLAKEDRRIRLIQKGGSVGGQFNAALDIAKGEYIAICEGDDCIVSDKYEKLYSFAKKNQLDVIRACYNLWFESKQGDFLYKVQVVPAEVKYNTPIDLSDKKYLFLSTFVNGFWNGLYNRDFLNKYNIRMNETKGAAFQDITFSFLTQLYAQKISFIEKAYHLYRIDNPESSVNSANCIAMLMKEYELLSDELKKRGLWEEYKDIFFFWEFISFRQFMDRNLESNKKELLKDIYDYVIGQKEFTVSDKIDIFEKQQKMYDGFKKGLSEFCEVMTAEDDKHRRVIEFFNRIIANKEKVILFGAGHLGHIIGDYFNLTKQEYIYIDNNVKLQKKGVSGHKVYPVCKESIDETSSIVIANMNYADEMYDELIKLGVDKNRIIICDYEDFFFREIYMKYKINFMPEG